MSRPRVVTTPPLFALLAMLACGGGGPEGTARARGLDGPDQALAWDPAPVFAVGGFEAPDWANFGSVTAMDFDSRGFLYVLDDQASTITKISPEGAFVSTIGRPGQGPGELAQPLSMLVLSDDRIAVADIGHRGFVIFDADGNWVENVPVDMGTEGLPIEGLLAHPSGDIVSTPGLRMSVSPGGDRQSMAGGEDKGEPIHRYAMDASREGSDFYFAWEAPPPPEGGESEFAGGGGEQRVMVQMQRLRAFTPNVELAMLPDGRLVVVDSTTYRLKLVDTDTGAEVGALERPIPPTAVDQDVQNQERDRRLAEARAAGGSQMRILGSGGGRGMGIDAAAMRRMLEDRISSMVFYPEIPVVEDIAVDSKGRIWVQRASGTPGEDGPTDIITATGDYLGTLPAHGLRIPGAFGPSGLIAVVETDEFDVPTIRVLRIPTS